MSDIDVQKLISDERQRREDARMAAAARIVEEAIQAAVPAAVDALEGRTPQPTVASNGTAPAVATPGAAASGPPPAPTSATTGSDQSTSAHSDALVAFAVRELSRSNDPLAGIEEKSRQLSTLTGRNQQELAQELANQLAQQPQSQPQPDDSTGSDQSSGGFSLRSVFRSDDR